MDEGDVFYALHGETRDSFKEGQPVEARVRYIDTESGRFAKLDILPNEVEGLLLAQHAAEGCGSLLDLQRAGKLALGMTVRARVRSVGYADADAGARRFEVGLTMLPRDLADNDAWERRYCVGDARADDGGHGGHGGGGGEAVGDAVEMAVLSSVSHPHVVQVFCCLTDVVEEPRSGAATGVWVER